MAVTLLPVGAQPIQRQPQGARTQIEKGLVGQQQKAAVVDDQWQPPTALFFAPTNPAIPRPQPARGRAKNQHAQPCATAAQDGVEELLADGADIAQIMMLHQQAVRPVLVFDGREELDLHPGQLGRQSRFIVTNRFSHAAV